MKKGYAASGILIGGLWMGMLAVNTSAEEPGEEESEEHIEETNEIGPEELEEEENKNINAANENAPSAIEEDTEEVDEEEVEEPEEANAEETEKEASEEEANTEETEELEEEENTEELEEEADTEQREENVVEEERTADEEIDVETSLKEGELLLEGLSNVGLGESVTLDGTTQTIETEMNPFTIEDGRGTGQGWTLNVSATPLTLQTEGTSGERSSLPEGTFSMSSVAVAAKEGASSASEGMSISQKGALDKPGELNVITAEDGAGMGQYEVSDMSLSLVFEPQHTAAGTYSSTVTFSLVSGP